MVKTHNATFFLGEGCNDRSNIVTKTFEYTVDNSEVRIDSLTTSSVTKSFLFKELNRIEDQIKKTLFADSISVVDGIEIEVPYIMVPERFVVVSGKHSVAMLNSQFLPNDNNKFLKELTAKRDAYYAYKRVRESNPIYIYQREKGLVDYTTLLFIYRNMMLGKIDFKDNEDLYHLLRALYYSRQNTYPDDVFSNAEKLIKKYTNKTR